MTNTENQITTAGVTYTDNFAFRFVGCLISHDKRFFESLRDQLQVYQEPLMESDFMNDKEERKGFHYLMETLNELTLATRNLTDAQLDTQFKEVLNLMGFKKGSEVPSA